MATNPPIVDRIMDQLRLKLPGALDGVTQLELWNTVDDFLTRTNVWIDETTVELKPGKLVYEFSPSAAGASVRRIMDVRNTAGTRSTTKAWMPVPGTLQIASGVSDKLDIVVVTAVTIADPGKRQVYPSLPEWMWSEYQTELIDGTIGRMMGQPAKPYSNPQLAAYHLKSYSSG